MQQYYFDIGREFTDNIRFITNKKVTSLETVSLFCSKYQSDVELGFKSLTVQRE